MPTQPQRITSPTVLAAMAHPARRRVLDVLAVDGPSTVSSIAQRTGLAIGSVSHHLGVLSDAALIEEAPELARDRRERWWRPAASGAQWSTRDFEGDAAGAVIAEAAVSLNLEHHVEKVRAWRSRAGEASDEWVDAAFASDFWLDLTANELAELSVELNELLAKWKDRDIPDDGAIREPVFVFAHGVPAAP